MLRPGLQAKPPFHHPLAAAGINHQLLHPHLPVSMQGARQGRIRTSKRARSRPSAPLPPAHGISAQPARELSTEPG